MPLYAWVAIGSAAGGLTRFLIGTLIQRKTGSAFPIGTPAINIGGSFALGFLLRYALGTPAVSAKVQAFLTAASAAGSRPSRLSAGPISRRSAAPPAGRWT